jgi:hypothetical protein
LGESRTQRRNDGSGLQQLLGRNPSATPPRVRQFVTDTALAVIAEGFDAEAVVIARRERADRPPEVSCRIPPSWVESSGWTFELFGQLYRLLEATDPSRTRRQRIAVGDRHGWIGRQESKAGDLVAAVVRSRPFTESEQATLSRVVRSVAVAIGSNGTGVPRGTDLRVTVAESGAGWEAEVVLSCDGRPAGRGSAVGPTSELAVARAAAGLCSVPCEVAFAGRTKLDQMVVSIVVVNDQQGSPLLGLSVSSDDGATGPAEALLSAMSGDCWRSGQA